MLLFARRRGDIEGLDRFQKQQRHFLHLLRIVAQREKDVCGRSSDPDHFGVPDLQCLSTCKINAKRTERLCEDKAGESLKSDHIVPACPFFDGYRLLSLLVSPNCEQGRWTRLQSPHRLDRGNLAVRSPSKALSPMWLGSLQMQRGTGFATVVVRLLL